ncbi:MAG: hypothetical protein WCL17_03850 [Actinomycetota bacterium]
MIASLSTSSSVLVVAIFLATAVEMVEALTIVVAVGHTRGWRSALEGVAVALMALGALVGIFGPALLRIPINDLRVVVGSILLIFGMQWLRKAILRSSGFKAKHDEDAIFAATVAFLTQVGKPQRDSLAFVTSFKGVFLEGLEVVITVLTLGASAHKIVLASWVASGTVLLVALVGVLVAKQLSSVPENAMKMTVGVLLVSYGTFWCGEGLGIHWTGADAALPMLALTYFVGTWVIIALARQSRKRVPA